MTLSFIASFLGASLLCAGSLDRTEQEVWYTFDEGNPSGEVHGAILDQSLLGNHGTLYGAVFVPEGEGHALALDGNAANGRCVGQRKLLFGESDFSVEFWMQIDREKPGVVIGKMGDGAAGPGWKVEVTETRDLRVVLADGVDSESREVPFPTLEGWHYVAIVREGETLTIYIDGAEAGSWEDEGLEMDVSNEKVFLHLGRIMGPSRSFEGRLDDVGVWSRALDREDVELLFAENRESKNVGVRLQPLPREDALVLHYRFDSDPAGVASDLSGNGNDGVIHDGEYLMPEGDIPGALRFNGESTYVEIPGSETLRIEGDMTFEMWVRQNAEQKTKSSLIFGEASPSWFLFNLEFDYNLLLQYRTRGEYGLERVALPVTRKILGPEWSHIAVVVEYPRARFYKDGLLIRDQFMPIPGVELRKGSALRIGGEPLNGYFAPIDLVDFRLYKSALAAEEVFAHASGEAFDGETVAELAVEPNWYHRELTVRHTKKSEEYPEEPVQFVVRVDGRAVEGSAVEPVDVSGDRTGRFAATAVFPLDGLEGKTVEIEAGSRTASVSRTVELVEPDWIAAEAGVETGVPAPWTPVEVVSQPGGGIGVDVLGRRYEFGEFLLPSQITADGEGLLAGPSRILAQIDGRDANWRASRIEVAARSPKEVVLTQRLSSGSVWLLIEATLEYDGFLLYRFQVESDQDVEIDRLVLEFPFKTEIARFCYADRAYPLVDGDYVGTFHSGAISESLGFQFSPSVWIGDDERGLTWQAESDQYWNPKDSLKTLEVLPGDTSVNFVANLVTKPSTLVEDEAKTYEFALLATPVKPLKEDAWSLRIARYEPWGLDFEIPNRQQNGKPEAEAIVDMGVKRLFTNVQDIFPWPMPVHDEFAEALHGMVEATSAAGLKTHNYVIHQRFPVDVEEFDIYGTDMANRPMKSYSTPIAFPLNPNRPGSIGVEYGADSSSAIFMCTKSPELQDAFMYSLQQRLEEFNENGVYLDGTVHIGPLCFNEEHGCGYRDEDGKLHGTYPTFAVRGMMQRLYRVVKDPNPDAIIDVHSSFGYNPSGLAYADVMWTGEQWHHLRYTGTEYIADELTLDKLRTEFTGRQLGIAAETLHYRLRNPMKIAATTLLLDVSPRLSTGAYDNAAQSKDSYFVLIPDLWAMRDEFGADDAEKLFYYENEDYVSVSGEEAYATLLKHPSNGTLAVISNRSREAQEITVKFELDELGLEGEPLQVSNPLSEEVVEMDEEGQISVALGSEEWCYVWLKPEGAAPVLEEI